jgi:hypothetical protein
MLSAPMNGIEAKSKTESQQAEVDGGGFFL